MINTVGGTANNYIKRTGYGSFPVNTGDWTIFLRFRITATPAVAVNLLSLFDGPTDFSGPYVYFGTGVNGTDQINVEINNTSFTETTNFAVVHGTQYWAAITYNSATHTFTFILNGTVVGTVVNDVSSAVWDSLFLLGDTSVVANGVASVGYCRAWSNILLASELTTESTSIIAAKRTGLLWDNPLQTSIDLTAHNNTLNQLTAVGVVTTDTTDPLLSVIVAPPTNTTPATATEVTVDGAFFQDTLTAGAATTVWVKSNCTKNEQWLVDSYGDAVTYKPSVNVYDGLANANSDTVMLQLFGGQNDPLQFPAQNGHTYYFKALRNGAVTPATLKFSLLKSLDLTVPIGSIAVNDDTNGYSCAFISSTQDYTVLNFKQNVVAGEAGDILDNGKVLLEDRTTADLFFYDALMNLILSLDPGTTGEIDIRRNTATQKFFIAGGFAGGAKVRTVLNNGTFGPTTWVLTGTITTGSIAASNDETILYYTAVSDSIIKRWDLINNVALADFMAATAGFAIPDMLVLPDNSILAIYFKSSDGSFVKHYSAAGATLNTYDFRPNTALTPDRLAFAVDNPNSFWVYLHGKASDGSFTYLNIKVSDGSILNTKLDAPYDGGVYGLNTSSTPYRAGNSSSCPFWITRVTLFSSVAGSGLYFLTGTNKNNPLLTHDVIWDDASLGTKHNAAIPNPFGETKALDGEDIDG